MHALQHSRRCVAWTADYQHTHTHTHTHTCAHTHTQPRCWCRVRRTRTLMAVLSTVTILHVLCSSMRALVGVIAFTIPRLPARTNAHTEEQQRGRHTHTHRHRQTQTDTHRHTQTHTHTHTPMQRVNSTTNDHHCEEGKATTPHHKANSHTTNISPPQPNATTTHQPSHQPSHQPTLVRPRRDDDELVVQRVLAWPSHRLWCTAQTRAPRRREPARCQRAGRGRPDSGAGGLQRQQQ